MDGADQHRTAGARCVIVAIQCSDARGSTRRMPGSTVKGREVEDDMFTRWSHYAALPLRIVLGCSFVVLGLQKLAGYFGGPGLSRTAELMVSAGLTPGIFWAWVAGLIELLGGTALVLGVFTRWTALLLALESLVAIVAIAAGAAINVEFRLAALAALATLALIGPQAYALDTAVPMLASWSGTGPVEKAGKAA